MLGFGAVIVYNHDGDDHTIKMGGGKYLFEYIFNSRHMIINYSVSVADPDEGFCFGVAPSPPPSLWKKLEETKISRKEMEGEKLYTM